jgi:hypothetical protein
MAWVSERVAAVGDVNDLPAAVRPSRARQTGEARDAGMLVGVDALTDGMMVGVKNHRHFRPPANLQNFAGAVGVFIVLQGQSRPNRNG